jgi:hypothetical protein
MGRKRDARPFGAPPRRCMDAAAALAGAHSRHCRLARLLGAWAEPRGTVLGR